MLDSDDVIMQSSVHALATCVQLLSLQRASFQAIGVEAHSNIDASLLNAPSDRLLMRRVTDAAAQRTRRCLGNLRLPCGDSGWRETPCAAAGTPQSPRAIPATVTRPAQAGERVPVGSDLVAQRAVFRAAARARA